MPRKSRKCRENLGKKYRKKYRYKAKNEKNEKLAKSESEEAKKIAGKSGSKTIVCGKGEEKKGEEGEKSAKMMAKNVTLFFKH